MDFCIWMFLFVRNKRSLSCHTTFHSQNIKYAPSSSLWCLFGPDNAALWRTMWFCRKVWLFDYGSYLNRKKVILFSMFESMLVYGTMFYVWEVLNSNLLGTNKTKINFSETRNIVIFLLLNRRTCRTMLHGSMQNHARSKKHVREDKINMCQTELNGGYLLFHISF
jgi:hypothetical protein